MSPLLSALSGVSLLSLLLSSLFSERNLDFALDDETPLKVLGKSKCRLSDRDTEHVSKHSGFARCVFSGGGVVALDTLRVPQHDCHSYPNGGLALAARGDLQCCPSEVV